MDLVKNIIDEIEDLKIQKKYNKAIESTQKALMKYDNDYRLYEELADIYLYLWQLEKALKAIEFSLKINSESATWFYLKWFILLSLNKLEDSIKYLKKSNLLMPNNSEVLRNLWWAYNMTWKQVKWLSILRRALNISPNDFLIKEDLAMALIWSWEISEWNKMLESIWKEKIKD